jgi:hypothetical protein
MPEANPAILPDPLPAPRWAVGPLPRIPYLPDLPLAARKALRRQATERAFTWWQWLLLHGLFIAAFAVPIVVGIWMARAALGVPWVLGMVGGAFIGTIVAAALWCGFVNPRIWQRFRGVVGEHGLCPHCGYDLRGVPAAPVCTECGARVGPRGNRRRIEETAGTDAAAERRRLMVLLTCTFASIVLVFSAISRFPPSWPILLAAGVSVGLLGDPLVSWDRRRSRKRRGVCLRCGCEPRGGTICCTGCEDPSRARPSPD